LGTRIVIIDIGALYCMGEIRDELLVGRLDIH